nr:MAG TPA: hypothetical protein [Caudoviricetes sp.]
MKNTFIFTSENRLKSFEIVCVNCIISKNRRHTANMTTVL